MNRILSFKKLDILLNVKVPYAFLFGFLAVALIPFVPGCGDPSQSTASADNTHKWDSLLVAIRTDTTYTVVDDTVEDGVLKIAVSNPNPDVVGHFNIHYNLDVVNVPLDSADSTSIKRGLQGVAVYRDMILQGHLTKFIGKAPKE